MKKITLLCPKNTLSQKIIFPEKCIVCGKPKDKVVLWPIKENRFGEELPGFDFSLDMQVPYCNEHFGKARWGTLSEKKLMGVELRIQLNSFIEFDFENNVIGNEFELQNSGEFIPKSQDELWERCQIEMVEYEKQLFSAIVGFFGKAENLRYVYITAVSDQFRNSSVNLKQNFAAIQAYEQVLSNLTRDGWELLASGTQQDFWRAHLRRKYSGLIIQNKPTDSPVVPSEETPQKKCPKCAEKIQIEALVCRYCGYTFSEAEVAGAKKDIQTQIEREKSDAVVRERQKTVLIRLRGLHNNIAKAKANAKTWVMPFLLGGVVGSLACAFITLILSNIVGTSSESPKSFPIAGCSGLAIFVIAWIGTTFLLRRQAKRQSAILVSKEEAALKVAVDEITGLYPDWINEIGGVELLLDAKKVETLLLNSSAKQNV